MERLTTKFSFPTVRSLRHRDKQILGRWRAGKAEKLNRIIPGVDYGAAVGRSFKSGVSRLCTEVRVKRAFL